MIVNEVGVFSDLSNIFVCLVEYLSVVWYVLVSHGVKRGWYVSHYCWSWVGGGWVSIDKCGLGCVRCSGVGAGLLYGCCSRQLGCGRMWLHDGLWN